MQTEAAENAVFFETHQEAEDRGLVATVFEFLRVGDIGKCQWPMGLDELPEQLFESPGASQARGTAASDRFLKECVSRSGHQNSSVKVSEAFGARNHVATSNTRES